MSTQYSSFRWIVLVAYMLSGLLSQLIWITFAPILSTTAQAFAVSEGDVGLLSAVFPLVYIIISIPVGYFIDSYGFRKAVLLGTGFMTVFGLLRAISSSFIVLLAFQTVAAIGQPFIMNSISKLVKGWFPEDEAGLATGLGSLSLYIGIIIGLALTPWLVESLGLFLVLLSYGIFSFIVLIIFYFLGKESSKPVKEKESIAFSEFTKIFKNRNILLLSILFFIGIGIFTAFTTWIEPLLRVHNVGKESAGVLGGLMIIGGIVGSIVIPGLSDKYATRKKPLVVSLLISAIFWYLLTMFYDPALLTAVLLPLGFFFMSTLPLALELSAESVEKRYVGAANSVLYEFSQIGALLMIVIYESLAGIYGWNAALYASAVLVLASMFFAFLIEEKSIIE